MVRVTHPFHPWSGREFVFVAVAAGRCPFRVADLLALARLAKGCRPASG